MRKASISVLVVITLVFIAFTLGFCLGRNRNEEVISVSVADEFMTVPSKYTETVPETEEAEVISFPISINQADQKTIMALPGIGEVLAGRIVAFREENGNFSSPEDLLKVEGVGKKRLEEIMDLIIVGG